MAEFKRIIYKYPLLNTFTRNDGTIRAVLVVPKTAKYMTMEVQDNEIVCWCLVNPEQLLPTIEIDYILILTGQEFMFDSERYSYVLTCQLDNERVYHVFQYIQKEET